jgi:hypothetical protein
MSDHALYCTNTEVVPAGVANAILKRNATNDGWEFKTPIQLATLLQSTFTEQATNTTTGSAAFVTLLTQSITISAGSVLLIEVSASISNTNPNINMDIQLNIDAAAVRGAGLRPSAANQPNVASIVYRKTGLAAGAHTILLQWRTATNTAQCRPVATVNEHASIMIQEVTV